MPQTTSQQSRAWAGPGIFSFGFRPFFLFGAGWAALAMLIWVLMLSGHLALPTRFDPVSWHAHEFLFGYVGAIIGGFLLTAVPNWTGRLPVVGWSLAGLIGLWCAGRVAVAMSALLPNGAALLIDLSFPVVLCGFILREIFAGKNWRNLVVLALLVAFTIANLRFHLEAAQGGVAARGIGLRIGIATVVMMISVIGGRVIPSFTRNWLVQHGATALPVPPMQRFDVITLLTSLIALALWCAAPDYLVTGAALLIIGLLHIIRMYRWQGLQTIAEPLLSVLHLAYLFLPLGAMMAAASIFWPAVFPMAAALHFWVAGAFGLMTLAMMTRATLGHTGQDLHAGQTTVAIYLLMIGSVLARLGAAIWTDWSVAYYALSGALWISAFLGFVVFYGPALIKPKKVSR